MGNTYHYQKRIELYHLDGAALIFYGQLFFIVHDAFADFLREHHLSIQERLSKKDYFFPVVHAEADYFKPILLDDLVDIYLNIVEINNSSFKVGYKLFVSKVQVAKANVIHACIQPPEFQKIAIPQEMRKLLLCYQPKLVP